MKAKVDNENYVLLSEYKWHYGGGYAYRQEGRKTIYMHRVILNNPRGKEIDHINMEKLDNRVSNMRIASRKQNSFNKRRYANNKSGYKGVYWNSERGVWQARVRFNGKNYYLGQFNNAIKGHRAYSDFVKALKFGRAV